MFHCREHFRGEEYIVASASCRLVRGAGCGRACRVTAVGGLGETRGLESGFVDALAALRQRAGGHAPGRVAVDLAVTLADGEAISDLAALRDQGDLFGPVASDPTAWRVLKSIDAAAITRRGRTRARRAQEAALPAAARRSTHHQIRKTRTPAHCRALALGETAGHSLRTPRRPAQAPHLLTGYDNPAGHDLKEPGRTRPPASAPRHAPESSAPTGHRPAGSEHELTRFAQDTG